MDTMTLGDCLARRALALPASPIRALLNAHRDAETLDFSGGIPESKLFPTAALAEAAHRLIRDRGAFALQYAPTEGLAELREFIVHRLRLRGYSVDIEQVFVTHGSQHALCAITQVLGMKGRKALLEQPVYPGAVQAFSLSECELGALPATEQGWELSVLEREKPNLVYVIPHFQNPTGRLVASSDAQALAALAERLGFFVIEDDAYGELDFEGVLHRPVVSDCPARGILLGSFSKTLCPGLRLGYIVAPKALVPVLSRMLQTTTLQPGTFSQYLAWDVLSRLDYDSYLQTLRQLYQERAYALSALCRALNIEHETPQGGFFLWAETKGEGCRFAEQLAKRGVLTVPESAFRITGLAGPDRHLRLAFSRFESDAASRKKFERAFTGVTTV